MNIEVAKRMVEEASFYMERIYSESAAKDYGKGIGYLKTLKIIWFVTIMIVFLLIFIGYVAFKN
jgi:hypothetical protein